MQGAYQYRFRDTLGPTNSVDAKMTAIDEIDIGITGLTEHQPVPWGGSASPVAGRVIRQVRFGFNNDCREQTVGRAAHKHLPQEPRSNNACRWSVKGAR